MHVPAAWISGWLLLASLARAQAPGAGLPPAVAERAEITAGIVAAKIEALTTERAKLVLTTSGELGEKLKLYDAAGKEVAATRSPGGILNAELDPKKGYIIAPPPADRRVLPKGGLPLPARYLTVAPTGAVNLGGLFLRPATIPLTWREPSRAYVTELVVGYEFGDGAERALPAPKTVTFFAEGANARIELDTVTIKHSGVPGYERVTLSTGQVEGPTHFTARAGPLDELKGSVEIQREPGALKLSLPSTELPAFGVGDGELTVSLLGRDGLPLAPARPLDVQLSSRRLRQPAAVVLEPGKSAASVPIRTAGYGTDLIVAQSGALRAELAVSLVFPVAATVAALLGGALGGSARYLRNKRQRGPLLGRRVVEGMLVGIILVAAAWAGLVSAELGTGVFGTPFGAFVLGALSGYLGCVVLDRLANRTFSPLKTAT